jgi:hypothetical protein
MAAPMRDSWLMTTLMVAVILVIELLGLTTSGRLDGFLAGNWPTMPFVAGLATALPGIPPPAFLGPFPPNPLTA